MKFKNNFAFTLIELIVACSIFFIMVSATYIPYNYYTTKEKVRITMKEISQALYEARNLAINWTESGSNISVWLYFDKSNWNELSFFSYPYTYTWAQITNILDDNIQLIKKYNLQPNVNITWINSQNNGLFFFDAITWYWKYYYFDGSRQDFSWDKINISFSYNNADPWSPLSWEVIYFTETNIVDY